MAFRFERFTLTGGSFAPMVSIRKQGSLGLSQGALNRFKLLDGDWFVVLYYDKESNVLGIQPTKNSAEEGAIKLIKRIAKSQKSSKESVSSSISAKAFCDYYGISTEETRTFQARWDDENKMIIVELSNEVKGSPKEERGAEETI